jgi:hypothetical protein
LNALYYRIFVYGLIDFSRGLFSILELGIIDRISYAVRGFVMHLSLWSHKAIELGIIDRINYGVSALFTTISGWLRRAQTGILSFNMLEVQFGLLALIILIALRILLGG